MKLLLLVQMDQKIILDNYYQAIGKQVEHCDLRYLNSMEQADLKTYFKDNIKTKSYDRIICFLRFKKEIKQVKFIQTIPNLIILEHDACQNYIEGWKYQGKFSKHYSQIPWARILVSGRQVCDKLISEGYDAHFVPKGYDPKLLKNLQLSRDIECGFIGSLESRVYSQRKSTLLSIAQETGTELLTTAPGQDYLNTMNRIRFFISADVGLGEYMIKNFEAMACGCVLITWDQGEAENNAIGFKDMENVVLYKSINELKEKLTQLRKSPQLTDSIALAGQKLAEENFTWDNVSTQAIRALKQPLRKPQITNSWFKQSRYSWT